MLFGGGFDGERKQRLESGGNLDLLQITSLSYAANKVAQQQAGGNAPNLFNALTDKTSNLEDGGYFAAPRSLAEQNSICNRSQHSTGPALPEQSLSGAEALSSPQK